MKITLFATLLFGLTLNAQVSPEDQARLDKLNQVTLALAQELAKENPNLEVTETQDKIEIKNRTPPTVDVVDPKELKHVENIQGLFNISFGKGTSFVSQKTLAKFAPAGSYDTVDRNSSIQIDLAVRPPIKGLKRLLLGVGLGMENAGGFAAAPGSHTLARGGDLEVNESFFANWDVLILHKARAIVSTGYYYGSYTVLDLSEDAFVQTFDKEHAAQLRWSQLIYSSKDKNYPGDTGSVGVGYYAQVRYSKNRTTSLNFGLTMSAGADWPWLKAKKTK